MCEITCKTQKKACNDLKKLKDAIIFYMFKISQNETSTVTLKTSFTDTPKIEALQYYDFVKKGYFQPCISTDINSSAGCISKLLLRQHNGHY